MVGIGASAGGLQAASVFLENTPVDTGMAFVLVFHLDPKHKSEAAALLQLHTRMPVAQVEDRVSIQPNHVYVIPPNHGLSMVDGDLTLTVRGRIDGRPTVIDRFFRSLAEHVGSHAVGIVLSGTGSEGSQGLRTIKEAGGLTVAQDESEAEYNGMPHSAIATHQVDFVLPVAKIPAKLLEIRNSNLDFVVPENDRVTGEGDAEILQKVFVQLRTLGGHDFSQYKQSTILRRIARRMQVHQLTELAAYLELLRTTPVETDALFHELLISVTNFFRDGDAMGALEHDVMPQLCRRLEGHSVRVWVPGCATGEEAYSLAMLLGEACDGMASPPRLQIFATDVDERALDVARHGFYPDAIEGDVSATRRQRFFDHDGSGYTVKPFLREMILFTRHDLLQDPPFSKLDLISCRNLLIYLKADVQARVFALFHFALKPQSYLFLGGSESLGASARLYSEVDRKAKLFQSRRVPVADVPFPLLAGLPRAGKARQDEEKAHKRFDDVVRDELLVSYAPPCVIVSENYDIAYISGRVGKYLEPGTGAANYNILDMAHDGLRLELRTALFKAFHGGEGVRGKPVRVRTDRGEEPVRLTVRPLPGVDGHLLVVFEDAAPGEVVPLPSQRAASDDNVIAQLENELSSTRESLQTSIEELETSNEELRASNEELQSINEELQSTGEELETSREELQSTNEELLAVNHELQARNDELARANADLGNLISSTEIATLFLDSELRVRRYSPRATDLFHLIAGDLGRPFAHLTHTLKDANLVADAERVLRDLAVIERELASNDQCFYQVRLRPYRTTDNRVDGVVMTFVDVTARHQQEQQTQAMNAQLEAQKAYNKSVVATMREPLLVLDGDLRAVTANAAFYRAFHATPKTTKQTLVYQLGERQWDIPELRRLLEETLVERTTVADFEVRHDFGEGERVLLLNARRLEQRGAMPPLIMLTFEDVTERRARERDLALLAEVTKDLAELVDARVTLPKVAAKIGRHFSGTACTLGELDADGEFVTVDCEWLRAGSPSQLGHHRISDYQTETCLPASRAGEICVIGDVKKDPRFHTAPLEAFDVRALVSVPVVRAGAWKFMLTVFDRVPRTWSNEGVVLLRELAERIWTRLERAHGEGLLAESELRYRNLFESLDEGFCVAEMLYADAGIPVDYRFIEVNPAFYRNTGLSDVLGKTIKQLVPEHERYWFTIFGRVAATGESVRSEQYSGGLQRWFDVYAFRVGEPDARRVAVLITDITQRKQEERTVARLASIVDSSDDAITSKDLNGIITSWNEAAETMFGYTAAEAIGQPITALIIPADRMQEEADILQRVTRGIAVDHFETVRQRKDGSRLEASVTISPLRDEHGKVVGASRITRDISAQKRAERHRELLMHELNHRVKNTLAIVQALAIQTFRGTRVQGLVNAFEARLLALSGAHDVLTRGSWKGAAVAAIVARALEAWVGHASPSIDVGGPELRVRPAAALALALALHELSTNATKYGALSKATGQVTIRWSITPDEPQLFRLEWREAGGPAVAPPVHHGFGLRLISDGLARDLGGDVQLDFAAAGLVCRVEAPLAEIAVAEAGVA